MTKKCIYCGSGIDESSVVDVCKRCGIEVWGPKMFATIIQNMENAREVGDLFQGSVSTEPKQDRRVKPVSIPKDPVSGMGSFDKPSSGGKI